MYILIVVVTKSKLINQVNDDLQLASIELDPFPHTVTNLLNKRSMINLGYFASYRAHRCTGKILPHENPFLIVLFKK